MNWLDPFFLTVGISAIIFLIAGLLLRRFPPAHINPWYGCRTPTSMQSQQHWDIAQQHSAAIMIRMGATVAPFAGFGLFMAWDAITSTCIALATVAGMVAILIVGTERAIRKQVRP